MAAPTESGSAEFEVPFFWQAGHPWCVPTWLAMALNYFEPFPVVSARSDAPSGRVSNFGLATVVSLSPGSGTSISGIHQGLAVPADRFLGLNWDEGLVKGVQLQTYVRLVTGGIPGLAPAP